MNVRIEVLIFAAIIYGTSEAIPSVTNYECPEDYAAIPGSVMTLTCKRECNLTALTSLVPYSQIKQDDGNLEGDIAVLNCTDNYTAIGDINAECNADGGWDLGGGMCSGLDTSFATATQSSTWNSSGTPYEDVHTGVYSAELAIDGVRSSIFSADSCTHTNGEVNPWWVGHLTTQQVIQGVSIWNRLDCCSARLRNLVISVSLSQDDIDDPGNVCATWDGPYNSQDYSNPITINCTQTMPGRYVKILLNATEVLTLCEVELIE